MIGTHHPLDDRSGGFPRAEPLDLHLTGDLPSRFRLCCFELGLFELDRQGPLEAARLADLSVHYLSIGVGEGRIGVADGVRTRDLLDHNQALYQAELRPPCLRRAVVACRLRTQS